MASPDGNSVGWSAAGVGVAAVALTIDAWAFVAATGGGRFWPWGAVAMCLLSIPALIVFGRRDLWARTAAARVRLGAAWTHLVASPLVLAVGAVAVSPISFHGGMVPGEGSFVAAYLAVGLFAFVVPLITMMIRKRLDKWRGHEVPDQSEPYLA